jgi:hypothetical protein
VPMLADLEFLRHPVTNVKVRRPRGCCVYFKTITTA